MNRFFGRRALLERIQELHRSNQHISVVGARAIGKTRLLEAVVERHARGSDLFTGAGYVDLRHDPPASRDAALRRVAVALRDIVQKGGNRELAFLADLDVNASAEELNDQLQIALDVVAESKQRILLVLDGCDAVLQNSSIPRNLWDNIRALAQKSSLRLMTGSRDQLLALCYSPDARGSDFFGIFYPQPIVVGPFDDADWQDIYSGCGIEFDGSAKKELVNWTGGHPDLVTLLIGRLRETRSGRSATKLEVDSAADSLLSPVAAPIEALWRECSEESAGDIIQLTQGDLPVPELRPDRVRFLVGRGIANESGNRVKLANRFIARLASARTIDVSGARRLFERPEDFAANIRTVLELRIAQSRAGDPELTKLVRRAVKHLPDEPDAALGSARDIVDRALDLVWDAEAPGGRVPTAWVEAWKFNPKLKEAVAEYSRDPRIPEARGRQCGLLRIATGGQFIEPVVKRVSKPTYVLVENMNHFGDLKNHFKGEPTLTLAVAFCMAAIELVESLGRELTA
jgi:hypothetical protein